MRTADDLAMCAVFDFAHSLRFHFHGSTLFLRSIACSISQEQASTDAHALLTQSAINYRNVPLNHRSMKIDLPLTSLISLFQQEENGDSRFRGSAGLARQGNRRHVY